VSKSRNEINSPEAMLQARTFPRRAGLSSAAMKPLADSPD